MSHPDPALSPVARDGDTGTVFRAPWEAQAFAMVVLLHERGHFTWSEWAARLGDELAAARARGERDDGTRYYHHWLTALEKLLRDKQVVTPQELRSRREAWDHAANTTPHGKPIVLPGR